MCAFGGCIFCVSQNDTRQINFWGCDKNTPNTHRKQIVFFFTQKRKVDKKKFPGAIMRCHGRLTIIQIIEENDCSHFMCCDESAFL